MASVIKVDTIKSTTGNTAITISESGVPQSNVPAFGAYLNQATYSISSGSTTTLDFLVAEFDTHSWFDELTGYYTPQIEGYYQFNTNFGIQGSSLTRSISRLYIYPGTGATSYIISSSDFTAGVATSSGGNTSALVKITSGQSVYAAVYQLGTSPLLQGSTDPINSRTRFSGFLVRAL